MDASAPPSARRSSHLFDAGLTVAVFAFLTWVMSGHVPSNDPFYIWLWAAVTASCLSALFWLAVQMFRAVLQAQRAANKK